MFAMTLRLIPNAFATFITGIFLANTRRCTSLVSARGTPVEPIEKSS